MHKTCITKRVHAVKVIGCNKMPNSLQDTFSPCSPSPPARNFNLDKAEQMLRKVSERESVKGRGGVFAEWKGECKHTTAFCSVLFTQPAGNSCLPRVT